MSLPVTARLAGPYNCNGSVVAFDFAFKVFAATDLLVVLTNSAGTETDLAINTHYSVSLNADQENDPGGTITTVSTYATGYKITILGALTYGQPTVLTNLGAFFPKVIEYAMDRLGILIQQVKEEVDRAVKVPVSSGTDPDVLIANLEADAAAAAASEASAAADAAIAAAAAALIAGFENKHAWTTATVYAVNNLVQQGGTTYICIVAHTSGTFATDYAAAKWEIFAQQGAAGAGTGDVLAANNGSDFTNAATFRANLGLTIGTHVQAYMASASEAEMVAGTEAGLRAMSPLRVAQAIAALASGGIGSAIVNNTTLTLTSATHNSHIIRCTVAGAVYTFPDAAANTGMYFGISNATSNNAGVRLLSNGGLVGGAAAAGTTTYVPAYSDIWFQSDGTNWIVIWRNSMFWEFNANGTWYCPPGVYEIEVDGSGGGGGGGGDGSGVSGAGGGSGARCKGKKVTTVPGTAYTVTIGAGGAAGAAGSATSLGALLSLAGGGAGTNGGVGGAAGAGGMDGQSAPSSGAGVGGVGGLGGYGGTGTGTPGAAADANTGGGGGGGYSDGANGSFGGAGGSGYLRVRA